MYGKRLYADILEPLGKLHDDFGIVVPPQSSLHRYRFVHRLYHGLGNRHELVRLAHHSRARSPAGYLAHRAAEVDVYDVRAVAAGYFRSLVRHTRRLHHGLGDVAVDLYGYRGLLFVGVHLGYCLLRIANQSVGRDELGIHHIRPLLTAEQAERDVGDVFHRRQQKGLFAQIHASNLHRCAKLLIFVESAKRRWKISTVKDWKCCVR